MDHPRGPVVHVHHMQTDEIRVSCTVSHSHVHGRASGRHANGPGLQGLRIHYITLLGERYNGPSIALISPRVLSPFLWPVNPNFDISSY